MEYSQRRSPSLQNFLAIVLLATVGVCFAFQTAVSESFRRSVLSVETANGDHRIEVEIAETAAQRSLGLQYRRQLPPNSGMLFDFGKVGSVTMWMKNTPLSLDMLFIDQSGKIVQIEKATKPYSLDFISSKRPVKAVLELPAGTSDRLEIRTGDFLRHPVFK